MAADVPPDGVAPFTVKARRLVGANRRWRVHFDHVADGRGHEVTDYLVVDAHEPRPDRVTGIVVLPEVDGRFGLVRSYRHALGAVLWEAPKGFVEPGEALRAAALRELEEETGLICAPDNVIALGTTAPMASTVAARAALFAATRCAPSGRPVEGELGLGGLHLLSAADMARMASTGAIEDAITLIAYYRYCALTAAGSGAG